MKQILVPLFCMISISSIAQTKLIAFKSHSGNMDNFKFAMETGLFNEDGSNFGNPPFKTVRTLDSVIHISPTSVVLIVREFRLPWDSNPVIKDSAKFMGAHRDTVYDRPLFVSKLSLDTMNDQHSSYFKMSYDTKNTKIIGYDNKKIKEKKKDSIHINTNNKVKENILSPVVITNSDPNDNSPFDAAMLKALGGIFLLAILGGWLSTKFYNLRLQKA